VLDVANQHGWRQAGAASADDVYRTIAQPRSYALPLDGAVDGAIFQWLPQSLAHLGVLIALDRLASLASLVLLNPPELNGGFVPLFDASGHSSRWMSGCSVSQ